MMDATQRLREAVARHPYPLVFATISGAHLYGFPSPDSDYDLRGCHVLPVQEVVGLDAGRETIESSTTDGGFEARYAMASLVAEHSGEQVNFISSTGWVRHRLA